MAIHIVPDSEALANAAAKAVSVLLAEALDESKDPLASLVLSGGATPSALYERLAGKGGKGVAWPRVRAFWGDERCVPRCDARSNFELAARSGLLERPFAEVHRIEGERPPEQAADLYEEELRRLFGDVRMPSFDVVLLGLGEDGHVASLLPGSPGLGEHRRWVIPTEEHDGVRRVTLTMPVLASARSIIFLVSGAQKAAVLARVLGDGANEEDRDLPARRLLEVVAVQQKAGWEASEVSWFVDREAASGLPEFGAPPG